MNPFTKTHLRLGKLQTPGRPVAQPQPTTAEEEAILFGVAEPAPELRNGSSDDADPDSEATTAP
jgi:hypothetical protein